MKRYCITCDLELKERIINNKKQRICSDCGLIQKGYPIKDKKSVHNVRSKYDKAFLRMEEPFNIRKQFPNLSRGFRNP